MTADISAYIKKTLKLVNFCVAILILKLEEKKEHCQPVICYYFKKGKTQPKHTKKDFVQYMENGCFWTVVLEKTLESPLNSKEIKSVNSKGNQPWIFIERTDAEAEGLVLWPPAVKSWLTDAGKNWGQEGEGSDRGWDGWMASLTHWIWVWANSGR